MTDVSDIDRQIAELEAQKQQIVQQQKDQALKKVQDAIAELNALGFNYSLSEGSRTRSTGTRRTGVRQDVLKAVKAAGPDGISRADLLAKLDANDNSAKQSISNALANLKKAGEIDGERGHYQAA